MTEKITFATASGASASGEIALPHGDGAAPGVVLIQEYWGLNDHVRSLLERLAGEGFVALAPDLYGGKLAGDATEAAALMSGLDWPRALEDIGGAVEALRQHPACRGKVGILGFCMGGALSFAAATRIPGLGAVVPFYGVPDASKADYTKVTAPIQAHFARRDDWAKPELAEAIQAQLADGDHPMELHVYDAQHAFVNDTRPEVYDAANARLAWERATAFLRANLA